MNHDEQNRDQAERLRNKIEQIKENPTPSRTSKKLPPRREVHDQKRKKTKWKLKYPIIRLLVLFFILLPIVIFSIYTYNEKQRAGSEETVSTDPGGYERVDIETDEEDENTDESSIDENNESEDESSTKEENHSEVQTDEDKDAEPSSNQTAGNESSDSNTDKSTDESTSGESKDTPAKETIIHHKVQANETLFRIAMKYYKSQSGVEIIKKANSIQGNEIQAGQVLKIPIKK